MGRLVVVGIVVLGFVLNIVVDGCVVLSGLGNYVNCFCSIFGGCEGVCYWVRNGLVGCILGDVGILMWYGFLIGDGWSCGKYSGCGS